MKQKLSLQQKMLQKLSPQQIQVIKLLEIPALQLEQRIKKELEENPVLEVEEDSHYGEEEVETPELRSEEDKDNEEFSVEDYMPEDEIPGYRLQTNNYSPDDRQVDIPFSVGDTFHEYLQQQAEMENFSDRELQLAKYILGNIDEDGYLRRDLLSISDDLAFHLNMDVQEEELEKILRVIQGFDPLGWEPGICRRACCFSSKGGTANTAYWQPPSSGTILRSSPGDIMIKLPAG